MSPDEIVRRFRGRRLARNVVFGLVLCAGAGILVLRFGRDSLSEDVFWIGLAVVLVVAIGGIFATAFIWRCPSCNHSLWSLPNPDRCPGCKSAFR